MRLFKDVKTLKDKITELIEQLNLERIISIAGYELYTRTFMNKFRV